MPRRRTYRRKTKSTGSRKSKITKRRVQKTKRRRTHIKMRYRRGGSQRDYDSPYTDADREAFAKEEQERIQKEKEEIQFKQELAELQEREKARKARKAREAEENEKRRAEENEKRRAEDPNFDLKKEAETYTEEKIIEEIENILNNQVGDLITEQKENAITMKDVKDSINSIDSELEKIEKSIKSLKESTVVFTISSRESQIKPLMAKQAQLETKKEPLVLEYTTLVDKNKDLLNTIDTYRIPLEKLLEIYVRRFPNTEHRSKYADLKVYFAYTVPDNEWTKALLGRND